MSSKPPAEPFATKFNRQAQEARDRNADRCASKPMFSEALRGRDCARERGHTGGHYYGVPPNATEATLQEPQKCVTQTNPDGRGDGDCEDKECRARMPHDRFHGYST